MSTEYSRIREAFMKYMAEAAAKQMDENVSESWAATERLYGPQDSEEEDYRFT